MPIYVNHAVEGDYEIKIDDALPFCEVTVCPVASKMYLLSIEWQVKSIVNDTFQPIFMASENKSQTALQNILEQTPLQ